MIKVSKVSESLEKYNKIIKSIKDKGIVLTERTIPNLKGKITIYCIKQIIDMNSISDEIVKPIIQYCSTATKSLSAEHAMDSVIYSFECKLETDEIKVEDYILDGMIVILFSNDPQYVVVNLKRVEQRNIPEPEIAYTIRGPRDCFVENLDSNLSLVRYRLKDPNLRIDNFVVGERTKTAVAVIYMKDIANNSIVKEIEKRISKIKTDSIWGTAELQGFLLNHKYDLFPQTTATERSDMACEAVMEGRVLILADGGQIALLAPHIFGHTLEACDDRYDNKFFGTYSLIIRYTALFITLCLPSIYIALVSFHTYMLPAEFIISLAEMRQNVLFSAIIEVLIIEFITELIRESLLRVPSKIGTAIGIVGAIVIGQAATQAGLFTPFLLIIAATTLMSSFAIPDYFGAHPIRILKFLVLLLTAILGFFGFVIALTIILLNLVSNNSFGIPYMAPFAPFNFYDFKRAFVFDRSNTTKRQQYLRTKDEKRAKINSVQKDDNVQ